jgi:hypothetical protein
MLNIGQHVEHCKFRELGTGIVQKRRFDEKYDVRFSKGDHWITFPENELNLVADAPAIEPKFCLLCGNKCAVRYCSQECRKNAAAKRAQEKSQKIKLTRIPLGLRELNIIWNSETTTFIQLLAKSSKTRLQLETTDSLSKKIEDKYYELTNEVIVPTSALYVISPDMNKWGTKGSLTFDTEIIVPVSLDVILEKEGRINSTELFWALVRLGFRLGDEQNEVVILKNIPEIKKET